MGLSGRLRKSLTCCSLNASEMEVQFHASLLSLLSLSKSYIVDAAVFARRMPNRDYTISRKVSVVMKTVSVYRKKIYRKNAIEETGSEESEETTCRNLQFKAENSITESQPLNDSFRSWKVTLHIHDRVQWGGIKMRRMPGSFRMLLDSAAVFALTFMTWSEPRLLWTALKSAPLSCINMRFMAAQVRERGNEL